MVGFLPVTLAEDLLFVPLPPEVQFNQPVDYGYLLNAFLVYYGHELPTGFNVHWETLIHPVFKNRPKEQLKTYQDLIETQAIVVFNCIDPKSGQKYFAPIADNVLAMQHLFMGQQLKQLQQEMTELKEKFETETQARRKRDKNVRLALLTLLDMFPEGMFEPCKTHFNRT